MSTRSKSLRISSLLSFGMIALAWAALANIASATERNVTDNVKYVYPLGNGNFIIAFVNPQPACTSASSPQYFNVTAGSNGVTADGVKAMLAAALTALAADKQLSIAYDDSTANCYVNRITVIS